jgi:hypothetical protein
MGSSERPLMKKEATSKMQKDSSKRPLMKKRGNPKNAKGLIKKSSDEKDATLKSKSFQTYTFIEASSANPMVKDEGDIFQFKSQIASCTKATN